MPFRFAAPLLSVLACLAASCSTPHAFRLEDVATLTLGSTTRAEVQEALGAPSAVLEQGALYESRGSRASPRAPLSFLTWPLYLGRTSETYVLLARYDDEGLLVEASLTLEGFRSLFFLVILNPHGPLTFEEDEYRGLLLLARERGIDVWVRAGYGRTLERYDPAPVWPQPGSP